MKWSKTQFQKRFLTPWHYRDNSCFWGTPSVNNFPPPPPLLLTRFTEAVQCATQGRGSCFIQYQEGDNRREDNDLHHSTTQREHAQCFGPPTTQCYTPGEFNQLSSLGVPLVLVTWRWDKIIGISSLLNPRTECSISLKKLTFCKL